MKHMTRRTGSMLVIAAMLAVSAAYAVDDRVIIRGATMEFRHEGAVTVYADGVVVRTGGNRLSAREAVVNDRTREVMIEGEVAISWAGTGAERIRILARRARYDRDTGRGIITGSPVLYVVDESSGAAAEMDMRADVMELDDPARRVHARGGVYISTPYFDAWSDAAEYDAAAGTLVLRGGPPALVYAADDVFSFFESDEITVYIATERVAFYSRARASVWGAADHAAGGTLK